MFIRKYDANTDSWNSLTSIYNNSIESSSLSNEATYQDTVVNLSDDTYEAYIENNSLEIVKMVDNQAEYSSIDNLEYPTVLDDFSYGTSSVVFGTNSMINQISPTINGKPTRFSSSLLLPIGLSLDSNTGLISGVPIFSSSEEEYIIKAQNNFGSATTSLRIKVDGPWKNLIGGIISGERIHNDTYIAQSENGDFYFSYFSPAPNLINGNYLIKKYDVNTDTWETIQIFSESFMDMENMVVDVELPVALTTSGNDLYVVVIDAVVNFSDMDYPEFNIVSYLKKYVSSTNSWETLGEFSSIIDPIFMLNQGKIVASGDDIFLASYSEDGQISVYQFNPTTSDFSDGSIGDFYPAHIDSLNKDVLVLSADDSRVYVAYTDISGSGGDVVIQVFDKATRTWSTYTDSSSVDNLGEPLCGFSLDSFKLDNDGNPYFSFNHKGYYYNFLEDPENPTTYYDLFAIKKLDLSTGTFVNIDLTDENQESNIIISFDKDGALWSANQSDSNYWYEIKKYVDGQWVDNFPENHFSNNQNSIKYSELFFDLNDNIYAFSDNYNPFLIKYEGDEAPSNYDSSVAPTISYPSSSVTYVTGRKIDNLYPSLTSSISSSVSCKNLSGSYCSMPSGLFINEGVIYGTPLVATSTTLRLIATNETGTSSFDIALNIIDPWVELGDSLSETAQAVSLAVDGNNKLWTAYSELSGSVNEIRARKYDNETWALMGDLVSDVSISASHPKIVNNRNNIYIVYREDDTGRLWVKKYNSLLDSWDALGSVVTEYSSEYFNIDPFYGRGVSVIYYDDISDNSVVKTFSNDYWEITGGYLEGGQYPSLSSVDEKIYAAYSTTDGLLSVESYEGLNNSNIGKEVTLNNFSNLVSTGDISPQGSVLATSTPAVRFNQRISLIPFPGASVVIPLGTVMTATENFDFSLFTASSTVDLTDINPSFNPSGVLMVGLPDIGLSLSSPITISIPISGVAENTQLQVYSKSAGSSWSELTTCYVIAGKCSFQTTHLSEFAAGTIPSSDSTPSSFGGSSVSVVSACTNVVYGDFSDTCFGGYQYRGIISKSPANCSLTSSQIEYAKRTCRIGNDYSSNEDSLGEGLQSSTSSSISNGINDNNNLKPKENNSLWSEIRNKFIAAEKSLVKKVNNQLSKRLSGRILLQVEEKGESWYINPIDGFKYFLGRPDDAFNLMRKLALGINNKNFDSFKGKAPARLSGRILLKVEDSGKAYYVNPLDLKMYYLGRPDDAFNLMRNFGLGAKNSDIRQIMIGD